MHDLLDIPYVKSFLGILETLGKVVIKKTKKKEEKQNHEINEDNESE